MRWVPLTPNRGRSGRQVRGCCFFQQNSEIIRLFPSNCIVFASVSETPYSLQLFKQQSDFMWRGKSPSTKTWSWSVESSGNSVRRDDRPKRRSCRGCGRCRRNGKENWPSWSSWRRRRNRPKPYSSRTSRGDASSMSSSSGPSRSSCEKLKRWGQYKLMKQIWSNATWSLYPAVGTEISKLVGELKGPLCVSRPGWPCRLRWLWKRRRQRDRGRGSWSWKRCRDVWRRPFNKRSKPDWMRKLSVTLKQGNALITIYCTLVTGCEWDVRLTYYSHWEEHTLH